MSEIPAANAGTFKIGEFSVNRLGFGAMRITGAGIWEKGARHPVGVCKTAQSDIGAIGHRRTREVAVRRLRNRHVGGRVGGKVWCHGTPTWADAGIAGRRLWQSLVSGHPHAPSLATPVGTGMDGTHVIG